MKKIIVCALLVALSINALVACGKEDTKESYQQSYQDDLDDNEEEKNDLSEMIRVLKDKNADEVPTVTEKEEEELFFDPSFKPLFDCDYFRMAPSYEFSVPYEEVLDYYVSKYGEPTVNKNFYHWKLDNGDSLTIDNQSDYYGVWVQLSAGDETLEACKVKDDVDESFFKENGWLDDSSFKLSQLKNYSDFVEAFGNAGILELYQPGGGVTPKIKVLWSHDGHPINIDFFFDGTVRDY